jgi:hypothetical protein
MLLPQIITRGILASGAFLQRFLHEATQYLASFFVMFFAELEQLNILFTACCASVPTNGVAAKRQAMVP